jgi:energy-converting hydrogenase Eha subunit C
LTNLATEKTDLDSILLLTQDIDNNSTIGEFGRAIYTKPITFMSHLQITRGTDISSHAIGKILNNNGLNTLPYFDLSTFGIATPTVHIRQLQVASSGSPRNISWVLTPSPTMGAQTFNDNDAFNPSNSDYFANPKACFSGLPTSLFGTYFTQSLENSSNGANINAIIMPDANQHIYVIPIVSVAFSPNSGEIYDLWIKGEIE